MSADPAGRSFWIRHHPYERLDAEPGETARIDADDRRIIERVVAAYRRTPGDDFYGRNSMWKSIRDERQRELHGLLAHGRMDDIAEALRNPKDNYLLYGFETLFKEAYERASSDHAQQQKRAAGAKDHLVRLAEAISALRVENPEGGPWLDNVRWSTADVIELIERKLGFPLAVPWPYGELFGLKTHGGVFGQRMIHAAYCAHRVRLLGARKVLEIGAGLGHLARYGYLMGIRDYTIVDLPFSSVSQGYFLMRTLGEDAVVLEGEPYNPGAIRILTPAHLDTQERYDLAVNVDGLTELGRDTAERYLARIFAVSDRFLSINHESNQYTVNELARGRPDLRIERFPYWMRNGYVGEIVRRR